MASGHEDAVLRQIGRLFAPGTVSGLSEWQLLNRYVSRRDETAFEALVARHGPMVLGVCRRVLDDPNDVDDAFQATFLVLVRKAGSLREHDAIGHWLYGVAHRVALRARSDAARRRRLETRASPDLAVCRPDTSRVDLGPVLDEELGRLPARYRAPVVLCYLEGLTHEEAAGLLDWPLGTVKGRLARAREILKGRLTRRGLATTIGAIGAWIAPEATAAVPESLLRSTVATAMRVAEGPLAAGAVSAPVRALFEGVLATMYWTKLKTAMAVLLVLGLLGAGAGVIAQQGQPARRIAVQKANDPPRTRAHQAKTPAGSPAAAALATARVDPDVFGGPDPAQRDLADEIFKSDLRDFVGGEMDDLSRLAQWSRRIVEASGKSPAERSAALKGHLDRMTAVENAAKQRSSVGTARTNHVRIATYYRQDASRMLAQAAAGLEQPVPGGATSRELADNDPRSRKVFEKLEEPVMMSFANETPLEDVLKYVKSATAGPKTTGIPIYVDPISLQEAEKSMTSPVALDLEGVPLRVTLRLILTQLGLTYKVKDGVLMITASSTNDEDEDTPLFEKKQKANRGELNLEEMKTLAETLKLLNEIEKLRREWEKLQ